MSNGNIDSVTTTKRKSIETQFNSSVLSTSPISPFPNPNGDNNGHRSVKPESSSDIKRNNFMDPMEIGAKGTSGAGVSSRQRRRDLIIECRKLRNEVNNIYFF
jgi:hypothetical protein